MLELLGLIFIIILILANPGMALLILFLGLFTFLIFSGIGFILLNPFVFGFGCLILYLVLEGSEK